MMRVPKAAVGFAVLLGGLATYAGEPDKTLAALAFPKEQWPAGLALAKLPEAMAKRFGVEGVPFVSGNLGDRRFFYDKPADK